VQAAAAVYTDRTLGSVYLLDSAARRLLRLDKSGRLTGQVPDLYPAGESACGLWVGEAAGRALVLTDRRLLQAALPAA
jgi:hypothetical protein